MTLSKLSFSPIGSRSMARGLMVAALAAGGWALSAGMSQAQAREVVWSVGVQSPGVQIGVSNAPPVPVYVQRPQHHSHQRTVVVQAPPVVVYPGYRHVRPVVVAPAPVYYQGSYAPVYIGERGSRWDRRERRDRWEHRKDRGHRGHHRHGWHD